MTTAVNATPPILAFPDEDVRRVGPRIPLPAIAAAAASSTEYEHGIESAHNFERRWRYIQTDMMGPAGVYSSCDDFLMICLVAQLSVARPCWEQSQYVRFPVE